MGASTGTLNGHSTFAASYFTRTDRAGTGLFPDSSIYCHQEPDLPARISPGSYLIPGL